MGGALNITKAVLAVLGRAIEWLWGRGSDRVVQVVGGPARTRVVILLGGVLALSSAQISTVGAVGPQLETSLHLDNTKIGLLNTVTLLVAAVAVIPFGLLVDRVKRVRLLSISVVLWSIATILGAVASTYGTLLLSRVALGVVSASAGPAVASLTGDYFPSRERGRVYGYILTGEILGTAVGFVICGNVSGAFGWRAAFWVLGIPGFFLARQLWRTVPEPLRGGHSRLERGVVDLRHPYPTGQHRMVTEELGGTDRAKHDLAYEMAEEQGYRPDPELVLDRDPDGMSLGDAVRYILSIPTNTLLIISSALGYFFFAGLETFATEFVRGHFHVSQGDATLVLGVLVVGAVVGTLVVGPICDALTRHGHLASRVWVPAVCNVGAALALVPGLLADHLSTALPFCFIGTALISAANPPLDAARLDIMPPGLWGRAESTRTFLRSIAQGVAPLAFGGVADLISGFTPHQAPVGTNTGEIVSGTGTGLQVSFLIMLVTLFGASWFLFRARPTYPGDVATAAVGWSPLKDGSDSPTPPSAGGGPGGRSPIPDPDSRASSGGVMATDGRTEDPTVVAGAGEDPTVIDKRGAGEDPTVVAGGDDPTVVDTRDGSDEDPANGSADPPTRRLSWPRDAPPSD